MIGKEILLSLPGVLFGLTFHEYSHALAAKIMGDPTAKNAGRLTLNPLPHIDIIGLISLLLFRFGWAKPVPINPLLMRNQRTGTFIVSIAGPISNFLLAFLIGTIARIYIHTNPFHQNDNITSMLAIAVVINLILAFFNLIPIPPLDGSKILFSILNLSLEKQVLLEQIGPVLLVLVIVLGSISGFNILWIFLSKPVIFFSGLFLGVPNGGI